ncbi:class I adenylate-forming enzyme family protein [Pseudomonas sp. O230]|uniref:class I adenylate-forming enzyme family protein n=1 Tax=Pseudomonas sp. O230 TaxID=3159450 RepID=UPI00387B3BE2
MTDTNNPTPGWTVSSVLGDSGMQALHDPNKTALLWEHGSRTYFELRERALRLAKSLKELGLQEGDRVATLLFNRGEIFELYFACAYAGLTLVPVGFRLTPHEISSILQDCEAKLVFTETELSSGLSEALSTLRFELTVVTLETTTAGEAYEKLATVGEKLATVIATDIQMILYTSGTTGKPKGVAMRGTAIVWAAMQQATQFRGLDDSAVMLINAPMYNTAAMNESSIPTFLKGGTVAILPSRGWTAERFEHFVAMWNVTHSLVFPSMYRLLIEADAKKSLALPSMKWWYTGGENCPPALMAETRRRWPHVHLMISYGSTESGMATLIEGDDIEQHPGSVGRCVPGQSIRLLDAAGHDIATGDIGDVWTSGPAVMQSYWRAPELDAETLRNGWLKIGDLARMDREGWIYIVGRSKDLIISKGQNIYPAEIENTIRHFPAVLDVAVVGLPDEEWGESVCAAIILRDGIATTKEQILEFVLKSLASYKKPRSIVFVDSFPIRNSTKVDKKELALICAKQLTACAR